MFRLVGRREKIVGTYLDFVGSGAIGTIAQFGLRFHAGVHDAVYRSKGHAGSSWERYVEYGDV